MRPARERPTPRPLADGERPVTLLVSIALATALAIGVFVGAILLGGHHPGASVPGGLFIAAVLLGLAVGMYRRRYWAALGFELLIAFQVLAASIALVLATTLRAAAVCLLSIGLGGWLFWKLVGVLARIQATEQRDLAPRDPSPVEPPRRSRRAARSSRARNASPGPHEPHS
jgi:hypothetical protein